MAGWRDSNNIKVLLYFVFPWLLMNLYICSLLVSICICYPVNCLFTSFAHFKIGLSYIIEYWVLYTFWIQVPLRYKICKYFFPFCGLSFQVFDGIICSTNILTVKSNRYIILLVLLVIYQKTIVEPKVTRFTLMISFTSSIVLSYI